MDPIKNPYTPGAGTRPSELAGRDEEIENFKILLARLREGRSEQSQIITGLRGVERAHAVYTRRPDHLRRRRMRAMTVAESTRP